jgi:hypothetical protein
MSMLDDRVNREQVAFMEKHNNADLIECSTINGKVIRVIYYSPIYKADEPARQFFAAVRACEDNEE